MDLRPFKGVDEVRNATLPFDDLGPFSHIYCEHFLEHLQIDGALKFIRNCLTALQPGGRLRLSTPSLEFVMMTHFDCFEIDEARMLTGTFAINRAFHGWGHQFLWSAAMLQKALAACRFTDIQRHGYGVSTDKDFQGIELHPGYQIVREVPNVWIFEATRPAELAELEEMDVDFVGHIESDYLRYVRSGH
jgi:SAM-dependent methyltransferase